MEVILMFLMDVTFLLLCIKMKFNTVATADITEAEPGTKQYKEVFQIIRTNSTYLFPASRLCGILLQVNMKTVRKCHILFYTQSEPGR